MAPVAWLATAARPPDSSLAIATMLSPGLQCCAPGTTACAGIPLTGTSVRALRPRCRRLAGSPPTSHGPKRVSAECPGSFGRRLEGQCGCRRGCWGGLGGVAAAGVGWWVTPRGAGGTRARAEIAGITARGLARRRFASAMRWRRMSDGGEPSGGPRCCGGGSARRLRMALHGASVMRSAQAVTLRLARGAGWPSAPRGALRPSGCGAPCRAFLRATSRGPMRLLRGPRRALGSPLPLGARSKGATRAPARRPLAAVGLSGLRTSPSPEKKKPSPGSALPCASACGAVPEGRAPSASLHRRAALPCALVALL